MKVLVNGGLNLSELDGWWAEAFTPEVGWALGDGPDAVRVELYADGIGGSGPTRQEMTRIQPPANANGPDGAMYRASVPATRLATDYTPRIILFLGLLRLFGRRR